MILRQFSLHVTLGFSCLSVVLFTLATPTRSAGAAPRAEDDSILSVERIFADKEFKTESFGPYEWLEDGAAYTTVEPVEDEEEGQGESENELDENDDAVPKQLLRFDTRSGESTVLVTAQQFTPAKTELPLDPKDYDWSDDKTKLLIFTNTVKVWRENTRGDYWVLDLSSMRLRQIASEAEPSTLMFAKFSPDGNQVAYVRGNNLYVESLATGQTTALTTDGGEKLINGTFDWVYEEEFDLRDGFRWSPDGKHIAFWQLDSSRIRDFYMLNNTDDLYPELIPLPYPKVGTSNSECRIGIIAADGGKTSWISLPGDPREHYLTSMEWVADGSGLLIEQLNRLQNHRILWRVDATNGEARIIFEDRDEAWVDLRQKFAWFKSDSHRLVLSERDGWRHAYRVDLNSGACERITSGAFDVIDLVGTDSTNNWLYFTASPQSPTEQFLYRIQWNGTGMQRLTPANLGGYHDYEVAPNGAWAIHTHSRLSQPPTIELISLPDHRTVRVLVANQSMKDAYNRLKKGPHEFFKVTIDAPENEGGASESLELDGWLIKPPDFEDSKAYPILFYVYTEPWGQTARDVWGKDRYLWHLMLSQQGYIIATVDNRGTPAPRGRKWRKAIYRKIGIVNVHDQAAAAEQILAWPFIDDRRVGVWGWSGGGSMTLNAMFQHPEIYHVGMSVVPVGDQRLYDTIYQERYMGLPDDNDVGFTQGSPVTHAGNLQGKLLLIHGTGDDNVHYQNSEVIINKLIQHNRPFDMMAYPNRSHSIKEGEGTRQHLFDLLSRYLKTHLSPGPQ